MADNENRPHLHVEFYVEATENKKETKLQGRPIYNDVEFVRIRFAGDKTQSLVAPALSPGSMRDPITNDRLTYAEQFPEHYKAFKEQREFHADGTPLTELTFLTESKRAELRALNIHTAEALASLDGSNLSRLGMGARELKNQAQAYIDAARGSAPIAKLAAENTALQGELAAMKAEMESIKAHMASGPIEASVPSTEPIQEVDSIISTPEPDFVSPFQEWTDDAIKAWLKDATGSMPRGTPKHETLVQMADEANDELAKASEAA